MLLLYAVALGLLVGVLTRGRIGYLSTVKVKLWPVALIGLAFQALLFSPPVASMPTSRNSRKPAPASVQCGSTCFRSRS